MPLFFYAFSFWVGRMGLRYMPYIRGYGATMISSVDRSVIISLCGLLAVRFRQFVYDLGCLLTLVGFQNGAVGV